MDKVDTSEDAEILVDLTAISRYIERRCGQFFNKDAAAVAREFYGDGSRVLYTNVPIVSVTSVEYDDDADGTADEAITGYQLMPLNAADGPEPEPYYKLYLPDWASLTSWPIALIKVTAVYGWNAVPAAIKQACIHLTGILRLETPRAERTVSDIGQIIGMSREGAGIIEELQRHYGRVTI